MDNLKQYWNSWWYENDGRKRDRYPLKTGYRGSRTPVRYKVQKPKRSRAARPRHEPEVNEYRKPDTSSEGSKPSTWSKIKSLFDSNKRDVLELKNAYLDYRLPATEANNTQAEIDRVAINERFKQKLLERKYERSMLEELRRGRRPYKRNREHHPSTDQAINHADEVVLLRRKVDELEQRLSSAVEELVITKKKLEFAQEKNSLLEELFNDGNMETEYVKSRRNMTNLQNSERKPELKQLPRSPSPVVHVDPMFTSSPIRASNALRHNVLGEGSPQRATQQDDFYEKYPRIPETERLGTHRSSPANHDNEYHSRRTDNSLSPVRVDYSKYSSGM
ncbi:unnamed protein product [Kluyveromyces dobzhanskii CBS 2104]|uniref:WGS project CCBQ000000000 data, contig 00106 n=1 Tax=Kluyveromyces dobzhanskii CBS 2104 TaxID=1427455 RepID=A0A0A8L5J9_9SACH|nr:unnamed protein product [Kluyveromyces dobzhanskii CBS 2104]